MRLISLVSNSLSSLSFASADCRTCSKLASISRRWATSASAASRAQRSIPVVSSALTLLISWSISSTTLSSSSLNALRTPLSTSCKSAEILAIAVLTFCSAAGKCGMISVLTFSAQPFACTAASSATRSVASFADKALAAAVCDTLANSASNSVRTSRAAFSPASLAFAASLCNALRASLKSSSVAYAGFFGIPRQCKTTQIWAEKRQGISEASVA
mmetsp:Transcript_44465/g.128509  ORF Transcript_44465/g.128509 Transcript_44465/m.128509 type:complete len:216 (-) Transcript_44465:2-649(-)